jgi:glycosyltransferase involved in cell wall biosynthesis
MAKPTNVQLSLVVPAYNEARSIGGTLDALQRYFDAQPYTCEVIVVADGDDGTGEIARERAPHDSRVRVMGEAARRGKGRAIREAVRDARGAFIGFADADNKTPIEELDKIWPWFDAGFDVVIGSRGLDASLIEVAQPLHRRLGSKGFGLVMHALVGLRTIVDTQCGFKFFRGPVAHDLFERQRIDGYMFDVEVLGLAEQTGYRIKEVSVRWRDDADSRLRLVSGNWRNMIDLLRIRFGSYTPLEPVGTVKVSAADR